MIPFTGNSLSRASEKRTDTAWIEARWHDPASLVIPFRRLEPFISDQRLDAAPRLALLPVRSLAKVASDNAIRIFLGLDGDTAIFAIDLSDIVDAEALTGQGRFVEARAAAQMVGLQDASIIAQGKAMIDWHRRHGFCPNCGKPTKLMDAGYRRLCDNCNAEHFPRVDPVVIMLATHEDACLVGRGKQFPPGMFSALAGFVEPGETIEEAVRRELMEEASAFVSQVTYYATQPWPFPSSLMIGCFAKAESRDVKPDENELAEVRWLERRVARDLISGRQIGGIRVPPPIAIAHHLIKAWAMGDF